MVNSSICGQKQEKICLIFPNPQLVCLNIYIFLRLINLSYVCCAVTKLLIKDPRNPVRILFSKSTYIYQKSEERLVTE